MSKKLGEGDLSNKLESLYYLARNIRNELETIPKDTDYERRMKGLDDCRILINYYKTTFEELKEQGLLDYVDAEKLLDLIFDWALAQPEISIAAAAALGLQQMWSKLPERLSNSYKN